MESEIFREVSYKAFEKWRDKSQPLWTKVVHYSTPSVKLFFNKNKVTVAKIELWKEMPNGESNRYYISKEFHCVSK